MDLCACIDEPMVIYPGSIAKINTGLKIFLWTGNLVYKDIKLADLYLPRSSNTEMVLTNTVGLLDADFCGESFLKITARENSFVINPGDRLAQLVVFPAILFPWKEVDSFEEETARGEGGDGSTGGNYSTIETATTFDYQAAQEYLGLSDADMLYYAGKHIRYTVKNGSRRFEKNELERFKKEVLNPNANNNT